MLKLREGNIFLSKPYPLSPRFGIYITSTPPVAGLQNNWWPQIQRHARRAWPNISHPIHADAHLTAGEISIFWPYEKFNSSDLIGEAGWRSGVYWYCYNLDFYGFVNSNFLPCMLRVKNLRWEKWHTSKNHSFITRKRAFLEVCNHPSKKKPYSMSFCVNRKMEDWSYQLLSGHRKKLDSNFHPWVH